MTWIQTAHRKNIGFFTVRLVLILMAGLPGYVQGSEGRLSCKVVSVEKSASTRDEQRFLHADEPILLQIETRQPAGELQVKMLGIRILDYRQTVLRTYFFSPQWTEINNSMTFHCIVKIPPESTARRVRFQGVLVTGPWTDDVPDQDWQDLFTDYVLVRSGSPVFNDGWFPPERNESDELWWWCSDSGALSIPPVEYPAYLRFTGDSPLECFPERNWNLSIFMGTETLRTLTIDESPFSQYLILPACSRPRNIVFQSSGTIIPRDCSNQDDFRALSFRLTELHLTDYLPGFGFGIDMPDIEEFHRWENGIWVAPKVSFKIPAFTQQRHLAIQGISPLDCLNEPQLLTVSVASEQPVHWTVSRPDFCLITPLPSQTDTGELEITLTMAPFVFPVNCWAKAPESPVGAYLTGIIVY